MELWLVLGLVSSIEQYFRRNSILFVFSWRHLPMQKHHAIKYFREILGGRNHGLSPHLKVLEGPPPSPP